MPRGRSDTAGNGPCGICGRPDLLNGAPWFAPNALWNRVYGTPDNLCGDGILRCPECFTSDCAQRDIWITWTIEEHPMTTDDDVATDTITPESMKRLRKLAAEHAVSDGRFTANDMRHFAQAVVDVVTEGETPVLKAQAVITDQLEVYRTTAVHRDRQHLAEWIEANVAGSQVVRHEDGRWFVVT